MSHIKTNQEILAEKLGCKKEEIENFLFDDRDLPIFKEDKMKAIYAAMAEAREEMRPRYDDVVAPKIICNCSKNINRDTNILCDGSCK